MNRVTIQTCEFQNVSKGVKVGKPSLGFRMYDDEGQSYDNTWDEIPKNDLDVLQKIINQHIDFSDEMLSCVEDAEIGITINGTYYEWEQIKEFFGEDF